MPRKIIAAAIISIAFLTSLAHAESMKVPCSTNTVEVSDELVGRAVTLMALNIYFHRGDQNTETGKRAITAVVLNRMNDCSRKWSRSIRGVIEAGQERGARCDFSWKCDGRPDVPQNLTRFGEDYILAKRWFGEYQSGTFVDPTDGATWFIYKEDKPPRSWPKLVRAGTLGAYTFYKY
jgi:spore germination cell wall hydrolase CwlJ-like protein